MKLKQLESHLSEVDIFKTPKISLEQYPTSAHIASRMIYTAEQTYDDIGSATVVDLGTGTGAIALALANEKPGWRVCGADVNIDAVQLASKNALANNLARVKFIQSDWFAGVEDKLFNLLVSNPPYVEEGDAHLLEGDVRFEPLQALVAADRGFADLDHIVKSSPDYLQTRGWLLLEHGFDQASAVRELLVRRGFKGVETREDLAGQERITGGQWFAY